MNDSKHSEPLNGLREQLDQHADSLDEHVIQELAIARQNAVQVHQSRRALDQFEDDLPQTVAARLNEGRRVAMKRAMRDEPGSAITGWFALTEFLVSPKIRRGALAGSFAGSVVGSAFGLLAAVALYFAFESSGSLDADSAGLQVVELMSAQPLRVDGSVDLAAGPAPVPDVELLEVMDVLEELEFVAWLALDEAEQGSERPGRYAG